MTQTRRHAESTQRPRRPRLKVLERDTQQAILDWCAVAGIPIWVTDASLALGADGEQRTKLPPGWPDLTGFIPLLPWPMPLFVETKSPEGRLRPSQRALHAVMRAGGALVVVPRSLGEVVSAVEEAVRGLQGPEVERIRRAIRGYETGAGAA